MGEDIIATKQSRPNERKKTHSKRYTNQYTENFRVFQMIHTNSGLNSGDVDF